MPGTFLARTQETQGKVVEGLQYSHTSSSTKNNANFLSSHHSYSCYKSIMRYAKGRIPMVFNVVIMSPHGYFGQANVLGLPDTGGQVCMYVMYVCHQYLIDSNFVYIYKSSFNEWIPIWHQYSIEFVYIYMKSYYYVADRVHPRPSEGLRK